MITIEGIVLRERTVGEQDKYIDILTKDRGLLELSVRGGRKITGKLSASSQLFAYSTFCVDERKGRFTLNSAEPIHIFYGLRSSLSALSLAGYFAEVLLFSTARLTDSGNVLRLFLNTLYFLENGRRSETQLKAIFELRLMSEIGFMPNVLICLNCNEFQPKRLYFSLAGRGFYCSHCFALDVMYGYHFMESAELSAVRHIVLADMERLFNFKLPDELMSDLAVFTEKYMQYHLQHSFKTLDFYKGLFEI